MKKLIFVSLLVIPFCKAADPDQTWKEAIEKKFQRYLQQPDLQKVNTLDLSEKGIEAIPNKLSLASLTVFNLNENELKAIPSNLNLPQLVKFNLGWNQIEGAFPENLELPNLVELNLSWNQISYINPKTLFKQFPSLRFLTLIGNLLTQDNIQQIKKEAEKINQQIEIVNAHHYSEGKHYYEVSDDYRSNIKSAKR